MDLVEAGTGWTWSRDDKRRYRDTVLCMQRSPLAPDRTQCEDEPAVTYGIGLAVGTRPAPHDPKVSSRIGSRLGYLR
ncbi:unnamed protein product [Allacma fusca]|uniref:Uncharacterized protein n=1 Tax=Allacma fusca TaxID=39272 RepID=A0A8J2JU39_9HEXA|nr:unnamed protein product [Allacma fusca]